MVKAFSFAQFRNHYNTNEACLEEVKKLRFYNGISCDTCKKQTPHYKIAQRLAYSCEYCRHQVYPLKGTLFEKSSTSLTLWFYAIFLMVQTRCRISIKQLQHELGVTYKTSWNMYTKIKNLMEKTNSELLSGPIVIDNAESKNPKRSNVFSLNFFDAFEFAIKEHDVADRKFASFRKRFRRRKGSS